MDEEITETPSEETTDNLGKKLVNLEDLKAAIMNESKPSNVNGIKLTDTFVNEQNPGSGSIAGTHQLSNDVAAMLKDKEDGLIFISLNFASPSYSDQFQNTFIVNTKLGIDEYTFTDANMPGNVFKYAIYLTSYNDNTYSLNIANMRTSTSDAEYRIVRADIYVAKAADETTTTQPSSPASITKDQIIDALYDPIYTMDGRDFLSEPDHGLTIYEGWKILQENAMNKEFSIFNLDLNDEKEGELRTTLNSLVAIVNATKGESWNAVKLECKEYLGFDVIINCLGKVNDNNMLTEQYVCVLATI